MSGIDMVSERIRKGTLKIVRCPETMPLIRELGMYRYDETKQPQVEEPIDEDNHACDALRYLIVGLDRRRSVASIVERESEVERDLREAAEAKANLAARQAKDEAARLNIWDDDHFVV